jgi:hypothetical protein
MVNQNETPRYSYKLTGTDADGRRFAMRGNGNYLAAHNVHRGNLWESINGGPWRKVKSWYN